MRLGPRGQLMELIVLFEIAATSLGHVRSLLVALSQHYRTTVRKMHHSFAVLHQSLCLLRIYTVACVRRTAQNQSRCCLRTYGERCFVGVQEQPTGKGAWVWARETSTGGCGTRQGVFHHPGYGSSSAGALHEVRLVHFEVPARA